MPIGASARASGSAYEACKIALRGQSPYIGGRDGSTGRALLETPCVNICLLDEESGLCVGCGRSGDEIARWVGMTPVERRAIMAALPERLERMERQAETEGSIP
jgi:uncharacterized protein